MHQIHLTMAAGTSRNAPRGIVEAMSFQIKRGFAQGGTTMERFKMGQLANGGWCVWQNRAGGVNVALPTKEEAEKLISALESSAEEEFDLPAHLLGNIYPQMDEDDCANWSFAEAETLAHDLLLDGIDADAEEIYETIAEFIAQDADEL